MYPHPWADPKSRSTLGFYNLHHRSTGVQNWGIYVLDPPGGLDSNGHGLDQVAETCTSKPVLDSVVGHTSVKNCSFVMKVGRYLDSERT